MQLLEDAHFGWLEALAMPVNDIVNIFLNNSKH